MEYGYARVSSREQNEQRQLIALREFGIEGKRVFVDKQSGKDFERPSYRRLIKKLKPDDTLVIKSIDRLGRNYEEILDQWRIITKEKRAAIVVLDIVLADSCCFIDYRNRSISGTLGICIESCKNTVFLECSVTFAVESYGIYMNRSG